MDFNFSLKFDYSFLNKKSIRTNNKEISSVFANRNSGLYQGAENLYMIGYSSRKRIIGIFFDTKTNNHDIRVIKVILPDESKIKEFYCACEESSGR